MQEHDAKYSDTHCSIVVAHNYVFRITIKLKAKFYKTKFCVFVKIIQFTDRINT